MMVKVRAISFNSYEKLWESVMDETNISSAFNKIEELLSDVDYAEGDTGISISQSAIDRLNSIKKSDFSNLAEFDEQAAKILWEELIIDEDVNLKVQLSDRRLWADLTFCHLRGMVEERWSASQGSKVVETRLFILGELTSGKLIRQAVSRLWWYAHLCRDNELEDNPWHLLSVLCNNTEIQLQLTDRQISHNQQVLKTILEYLEKKENNFLIKGDRSKALGKWLVAYSGITELTILEESELVKIFDKIKAKIPNS